MNIKQLQNYLKDFDYQVINERKSWIGTLASSVLEKQIVVSDSRTLARISDAVSHRFPTHLNGGVIVFSTDVNVVILDNNKFTNRIKQFYHTVKHRFITSSKIDELAERHDISAWSVGNYFTGKYRADNGDKKSIELAKIIADYANSIIQR